MNNYQSYKDSGVEWIGEIPSHWKTSKIKYSSDGLKNSFIDGDWIESKDISESGIRYITTGNIGIGKYKEQGDSYITEETFEKLDCNEIFEGDLVISRLFLPVGRSCIIPNLNNRIVTSVDNVILRPNTNFIKEFLNFQFNSQKYSEHTELISRGTTLTRISRTMLGNNSIIVPPLPEQQQIVSFLDRKTQKIDDLIRHKEKKIELLKEKRTSLINHVVTKGLDPNVEMKDSGVEWIGEIPSHWLISKFKYVSQIVTGNTPSKSREEEFYSETGFVWVKPTSLDKGLEYVRDSEIYLTELGKNETRLIPKDSVMICCIGNTIGKHGISGIDLCTNQQINSVIPNSKIHPWFNLFYIKVFTEDLIKWTNFVTLPIYTKSDLEDTPFILPPMKEQIEIQEYLKKESMEIDELVELEQNKIQLLKEYRQSLISEVVTGKIRVCEEDLSVELKSEMV